jgi:CO/xanthine dehydrogenase Mo-binding subunit
MAGVTVAGTPVPRAEGPDKVTGRSIYAADVNLPNLLWGKILRAPILMLVSVALKPLKPAECPE